MRSRRITVTIACTILVAAAAHAQPAPSALSPRQIGDACAPPPVLLVPQSHAFHIIGAQDTVSRSVFAERDLLVVDSGTASGIELGQEYFLRRPAASAPYGTYARHRAVNTEGWIRIVAVNETTAIASIEHECGPIHAGDYLEPYVAPAELPNSGDDRPSEPDFSSQSRVLFGDDERLIASVGDFMLIDRGSDQGVAPGARFAIYRNVHTFLKNYQDRREVSAVRLPLASIGESVVVSASPTLAVVRVLAARDAVHAGDLVVPRQK